MSILNQALQDLEKRNLDNNPEPVQSTDPTPSVENPDKLIYFPFILIVIVGIFIFIQYYSNEAENILPKTKPSFKTTLTNEPLVGKQGTKQLLETAKKQQKNIAIKPRTQKNNTINKKDTLVKNISNEQNQHTKDKTKKAKKTVITPIIKIKSVDHKQQSIQLYKIAIKTQSLLEKQNSLEQAIKLYPQHINARLLYAHTLIKQNRTDETAEFLDQCLNLFPDNLQFISFRSQLFLKNKNPQSALNLLLKIEANYKHDETYLSLLAAAYQQNHGNVNAQQTYQKLVSINPEKAEYWLGLAITSEKQAANSKALDAYQQALNKNPLKDSIVSYIKQRISLLKK